MNEKPTLHCRTETVFSVGYDAVENFIQECTGHKYEIIAGELWHDDQTHRFRVDGKLDEWDVKEWKYFKDEGEGHTNKLRLILNGLCADGFLTAGTYVIETY